MSNPCHPIDEHLNPMLSHDIPLDEEPIRDLTYPPVFLTKQRVKRKSSPQSSSKSDKEEFSVLFLATHVNKLDKKGRVCVPAAWRVGLTSAEFSGVVITPSYQSACLDGFTLARMQQLATALDETYSFYHDAQLAGATTYFADAQPLSFDAEGRITLPEPLIKAANLTENVTFAGLGQFFQIWEPDAYAAHHAAQRKYMKENHLHLKLGGKS